MYQVNLIKDGVFHSVLCNDKGKKNVCLATAKKWANTFQNTWLKSEDKDCLQILLQIVEV